MQTFVSIATGLAFLLTLASIFAAGRATSPPELGLYMIALVVSSVSLLLGVITMFLVF